MQFIVQETSLEDSDWTKDKLRVRVAYSIPPLSYFVDEVTAPFSISID